ncbi:hypothetical protein SUGI_0882780 [Cryptomeria japonica]|nr:hypothetical protein SUGI_0882780 [Cryptomeria japonica]
MTMWRLERAFEAAITVYELEIAFRAMESVFGEDDKRLGMACLRMGQELESAGENPETILAYANRALRNLEKDDNGSIALATFLYLLGSVHYALEKFDESLGYLNRAIGIFENEHSQFQNAPIVHDIQSLLGDVKTALGRREEALRNYIRSLELKEELLEPGHPQLASLSKKVAEAYVAVLNFKEALTLCLKALDIDRKHLGENSVEVATDHRLLAVIYAGLGEYEKALEQNETAKRVLKIQEGAH